MSSEITLGAFLRRRVAVLLLALLSAWLVATPSQAAPHRAAQCAACAAEASIRNAVADQLELRQRARDAAATALAKTERDYDEVMRQRDLTAKAAEAVVASGIGMPIDTKAVANLEEQVRNARAALNYAKQRYARTMTEFTLALNELQRVTLLLVMCEAKNCPDTTGTAAQTLVAPQPAAVAAPPGIRLDPRTAACPACAAAATRRNDLAQSVMNGEMTVQSIRNRMFINQYRLRQAEEALAPVKAEADELVALINGGVAVRPEVVRSVAARKNDREGDVSNLRHDYGELLKELQAAMDAQALVYARYLQADAALTQCERQMCAGADGDASGTAGADGHDDYATTAAAADHAAAGRPAPVVARRGADLRRRRGQRGAAEPHRRRQFLRTRCGANRPALQRRDQGIASARDVRARLCRPGERCAHAGATRLLYRRHAVHAGPRQPRLRLDGREHRAPGQRTHRDLALLPRANHGRLANANHGRHNTDQFRLHGRRRARPRDDARDPIQ
jgi:hypothetical protein